MLFSATMPKQMEELSRAYLTDPPRAGGAAGQGRRQDHPVGAFRRQGAKPGKLREILSQDLDALTLVFAAPSTAPKS
jgi:ATP-dependent RNA helicase RhlE